MSCFYFAIFYQLFGYFKYAGWSDNEPLTTTDHIHHFPLVQPACGWNLVIGSLNRAPQLFSYFCTY